MDDEDYWERLYIYEASTRHQRTRSIFGKMEGGMINLYILRNRHRGLTRRYWTRVKWSAISGDSTKTHSEANESILSVFFTGARVLFHLVNGQPLSIGEADPTIWESSRPNI